MENNKFYKIMRVSGKSDPAKVAGALANHVTEVLKYRPDATDFGEFACIGPSPNNQALKAVAIANGMLAPRAITLIILPAFADIVLENEDMTAMRQIIKRLPSN